MKKVKMGDTLIIGDSTGEEKVKLIQVDVDTIQAIHLDSANRWSKPVVVKNTKDITKEELQQLICDEYLIRDENGEELFLYIR